jgi:hypothetical protein
MGGPKLQKGYAPFSRAIRAPNHLRHNDVQPPQIGRFYKFRPLPAEQTARPFQGVDNFEKNFSIMQSLASENRAALFCHPEQKWARASGMMENYQN